MLLGLCLLIYKMWAVKLKDLMESRENSFTYKELCFFFF